MLSRAPKSIQNDADKSSHENSRLIFISSPIYFSTQGRVKHRVNHVVLWVPKLRMERERNEGSVRIYSVDDGWYIWFREHPRCIPFVSVTRSMAIASIRNLFEEYRSTRLVSSVNWPPMVTTISSQLSSSDSLLQTSQVVA
jgi:hypothetical protein